MKTLSEIRHLLVVAAQKEYDDRIARGIHPYAIASYHFSNCITAELKNHINTSGWKSQNWKELNTAFDPAYYPDHSVDKYGERLGPYGKGLWAVSAYLSSNAAYATPGFAEAYAYHARYGG